MQNYLILALVLIIVGVGLKTLLWLSIPNRRISSLLKSFIRWFSVYDIHESPNNAYIRFRRFSNYINLLVWLGLVILFVGLLSEDVEPVVPTAVMVNYFL